MGLNKGRDRTFLNISFGRIRQRCKPDHPEAIGRELQSGEKTYAVEYTSVSGILEDIRFRDDPRYGKSWNLYITDGDEKFAIQVKEDTAFGSALLERIPNLVRNQFYLFAPYDFETQKGKRKRGLSIKDKSGEKISSYYKKFTEREDGGWDVENLYGYPSYDGDRKDKDELKIYFTRLLKFLRAEALKHIGQFRDNDESSSDDIPIGEPEEELPF